MILEKLVAAFKAGGWLFSVGCAYMLASVYFWDRLGGIELCLPFALGLVGLVIGFGTGGKTPDQLRARALRQLHRECARSPHGLEIAESAVTRVGPDVTVGERAGEAVRATFGGGKARVDHLQTLRITAPQGDFHLVIPWSGPNMLPHEFCSWMNGRLPASLTLKRGTLGSWSNGRWVGPRGDINDPIARAAEEHPTDMHSGVEWNWEKGDYRIELEWGVMAVPVMKDWYFHVVQTAQHGGLFRKTFGLDWFIARWVAFFLFVNGLQLDGDREKRFLYQPRSLLLFHRELGMDAEECMPAEAAVRRPGKIGDLI